MSLSKAPQSSRCNWLAVSDSNLNGWLALRLWYSNRFLWNQFLCKLCKLYTCWVRGLDCGILLPSTLSMVGSTDCRLRPVGLTVCWHIRMIPSLNFKLDQQLQELWKFTRSLAGLVCWTGFQNRFFKASESEPWKETAELLNFARPQRLCVHFLSIECCLIGIRFDFNFRIKFESLWIAFGSLRSGELKLSFNEIISVCNVWNVNRVSRVSKFGALLQKMQALLCRPVKPTRR